MQAARLSVVASAAVLAVMFSLLGLPGVALILLSVVVAGAVVSVVSALRG